MYNDQNRHRDSSYGSDHRSGGARYGSGGAGGGGGGGYRSAGRPAYGESGGGDDRRRGGMPLSDLDPALTDVSRRVIGAAIEVHKALGPGFDEAVYLKALQLEMDALGIRYRAMHPVGVRYRDQAIGERIADLYIDERFIVDVMAEHREIGSVERASLRALLRAADLELGLIINFAERRLKDGLVRVLNPDKLNAMRAGAEGAEDGYEEDAGAPDVYDPDGGARRNA